MGIMIYWVVFNYFDSSISVYFSIISAKTQIQLLAKHRERKCHKDGQNINMVKKVNILFLWTYKSLLKNISSL